jgi:hypothetical protein
MSVLTLKADIDCSHWDVRFVPIASFRVANFIEKASRLYEQERSRSADSAAATLEMAVSP